MKGFKKFLLYFAIVLGCILVIFFALLGIMYISPNRSILGFAYIRFNNEYIKEYNATTDPSIASINAFEISTENSDIYLLPNDNSDTLKIEVVQKHSGFVKTVNSQLKTSISVEEKSFEESTVSLDTFKIEIEEPTGWISTNKSYIKVYLPAGISLNTIYAKSTSGNVYYNSTIEENYFSCSNLYLKSLSNGHIGISNDQNISNYYFYTENGDVNFSKTDEITATKIKFESQTGSLTFKNHEGTATFNSDLEIKSTSSNKGPNIAINNLNGNLQANLNNGEININNVGSYGNYKIIAISTNKLKLNLGTVYGRLSILSNTSAEKNNVTINKMYSISQINQIELGAGDLAINELNANISAESTSGNIVIDKATVNSNIYTYTLKGDIAINYEYSLNNNKDNSLKVITKQGNINIKNISCCAEIKVLEKSSKKSANISFSAVSSQENKLELNDRNVNLKLIGSSDYLAFRLLASCNINFVGSITGGTSISVIDEDYLLGDIYYNNFSYNYRLGYNKDDTFYNGANYLQRGLLLVSATGLITLSAQNV